jgi:hypothetical protein
LRWTTFSTRSIRLASPPSVTNAVGSTSGSGTISSSTRTSSAVSVVAGRSSQATRGRKHRMARLAGATIRLATMRGAPGRKPRRERRWGSRANPFRSERSRRMHRHALDDDCRWQDHRPRGRPRAFGWVAFEGADAPLRGGLDRDDSCPPRRRFWSRVVMKRTVAPCWGLVGGLQGLQLYGMVSLFSDDCTSQAAWPPRAPEGRFEIGLSGVQLIDQCLGLLQVKRVEALGEPRVDWREEVMGFCALALVAPEPRHAHRCAQFPGPCLLRPRNR